MLSSHIAAVIWRTPCFLNRKSRLQALSINVFLDQKPPRPPRFLSLVLQKCLSPLRSVLPAHFLPLLVKEGIGTQNLAACASWQTKVFEGRCSLSDITAQISPGQEPAPAPTSPGSSLPLHSLCWRRQFSQPSSPAGTPSHFLPLCRPLLSPFLSIWHLKALQRASPWTKSKQMIVKKKSGECTALTWHGFCHLARTSSHPREPLSSL